MIDVTLIQEEQQLEADEARRMIEVDGLVERIQQGERER